MLYTDVMDLLKSVEEAINHDRGIMPQILTQEEFELNFLSELSKLEAEVMTVRDMQRLKRKMKGLHAIVNVPKSSNT